jgi:hypothetical protein
MDLAAAAADGKLGICLGSSSYALLDPDFGIAVLALAHWAKVVPVSCDIDAGYKFLSEWSASERKPDTGSSFSADGCQIRISGNWCRNRISGSTTNSNNRSGTGVLSGSGCSQDRILDLNRWGAQCASGNVWVVGAIPMTTPTVPFLSAGAANWRSPRS